MRRSEKNQAANGVENVALSAASRIVAGEYSILGSDGFTPSRGAPCQYFIEYGLYKCCEDESNYLRAITTYSGRIISSETNQHGYR
jgi:hypothetical protein